MKILLSHVISCCPCQSGLYICQGLCQMHYRGIFVMSFKFLIFPITASVLCVLLRPHLGSRSSRLQVHQLQTPRPQEMPQTHQVDMWLNGGEYLTLCHTELWCNSFVTQNHNALSTQELRFDHWQIYDCGKVWCLKFLELRFHILQKWWYRIIITKMQRVKISCLTEFGTQNYDILSITQLRFHDDSF